MDTQKVVIPKGMVNPNETTIIEIPNQLKNARTVVAKFKAPPRPKAYEPSVSGSSTPKMAKKRTYTRRTYPPKSKGTALGDLYEGGTSFGGRPYEDSADESDSGPKMWIPKSPHDRYMTRLSDSDVYYDVGGRYKRKLHDTGYFDPPTGLGSTMRDPFEDPPESSLYRDFRPRGQSSPQSSQGLGRSPPSPPPSMRRYESSSMSPGFSSGSSPGWSPGSSPASSPPTSSSYTKSSVTRLDPDGTYEEITEEIEEEPIDESGSSYYARRPDSSSDVMFSSDSLGGSPVPGAPRAARTWQNKPDVVGQHQVMNSLGEIETVEMNLLLGDLDMFQNARRQLFMDASSLAGPSDVSNDLLSSMSS